MITSGSVGGIYLPEMTDELIAEALKRSGNKYEIVVTEDLLKNTPCVLSPWNIKRYAAFWKWADEHPDIVAKKIAERRKSEEWLRTLRTHRNVPYWLLDPAFPESEYALRDDIVDGKGNVVKKGNVIRDPDGRPADRFFYAPKPNKYGLPWGKIEAHEHDYNNYGESAKHYADVPFLREFVEESGLVAGQIETDAEGNFLFGPDGETPVFTPHFERLVQLYHYDRLHPDDPTKNHEIFFYWVKKAFGELNTIGAPEETEAPEILPIVSLTPRNFYPKHAYGIMVLLNKLITEHGMKKYCGALHHLQQNFEPCAMLKKEPAIKLPELDISASDEAVWAAFTEQNKIEKKDFDKKPLRK